MPIYITGSKYGALYVASVNVTRVIVTVSTFIESDFLIARRVQLHDSAGNKKADAFVRRYISAYELELEDVFRNWKTGAEVTQVVGDKVYISKTLSEFAPQTGLNVVNSILTVSNELVLGTAYDEESLCLHQEAGVILFDYQGTLALVMHIEGGTVTFGHLSSWINRSTHSPITLLHRSTSGNANLLYFGSNSASFMVFGGSIDTLGGYFGAGWNGSSALGTDAKLMWLLNCSTEDVGFLSVDAGNNWADGSSHILENVTQVGSVDNLIMTRWANGVVLGGSYKLLRGSSLPISIFGSDAAGTFPVGANSGKRAVIQDIGIDNVLWRASGGGNVQTIEAKNLISTNFDLCIGPPGNPPQPQATLWQRFSGLYTNIVSGTVGVVSLTADSSIIDSNDNISGSWDVTVLYDKYIGKTHQSGFPLGPWDYSFKAYGYTPIYGDIQIGTYDLGTAGIAADVVLGGFVNQVPDTAVTLSRTAANALTSLSTLDDVYDRAIAWSVASVANAGYPSLSTYMVSAMGTTLDFGNHNLVVDATAGSVFSVNTGTNTVTIKATTLSIGTKFTKLVTTGNVSFINGAVPSATLPYQSSAGTSVPVVAPNLISGSRVQIYDTTNSTQLDNTVIGSGGYSGRFVWNTNKTVRIRATYCIGAVAKNEIESVTTLTNTGASFLNTQENDSIYNTIGISGSTCTEFTADYPNVQIDINDPDGVTYVQRIHAWWMYNVTTSGGISDFFGGFVAEDAVNFKVVTNTVNLRLNNKNSLPVIVAGGRIYRDDGTTIIATTSGPLQIDPDRVYAIETAPGVLPSDITAIAEATKIRMEEPGSKLSKTEIRSRLIPGTL